jgi:hypothetical protein
MKNLSLVGILFFVLFIATEAEAQRKRTITVSASQNDANLFIDGKPAGSGQTNVLVLGNSCVTVRAERAGYLDEVVTFCNRKDAAKLPKSYYIEMRRDEAYDASVQTDIANVDVEIRTKRKMDEAWRILNQIVTSYIDVIEITDKETGYLRTSWELQSFSGNTIRTRIIVRLGSDDPLAFRIKLVSEQSRAPGTSVKADELYREWDRVLRKYANLITEAQSRM